MHSVFANSLAAFDRLAAALARPVDALFRPGRAHRAILALLGLFVLVWTVFHVASTASVGLHPDLIEFFAWSRHPSPGYFKHPPLGPLMTAAWFAVFPAQEWAFRLLAMVNAAVALYIVDLIARRYLPGEKRPLVLVLLLLTPLYQFHAERFGANQTLLATWPLATYCFLRAFETRAWHWSAAAGAASALAMLGKYWSIYLVAGFVLAALTHPARRAYLKSPAPWISAAVGAAVLSPHLAWLVATGFQPLDYAFDTHGHASVARAVWKAAEYVVGSAAYVALPVAAYLLAVRPDRATLQDTLWPKDPDRRMLVVLLAAPLALPVLIAPLLGVKIVSLWTIQAWFLLPIVLLAPARVEFPRLAVRRMIAFIGITTVGALAAAPLVAVYFLRSDPKDGRAYYAAVSERATQEWRRAMGRPLAIVMGDFYMAVAPTFYSPDHPDSVPAANLALSPWVTPERLKQEGWLALCRGEDSWCYDFAAQTQAAAPGARRLEFDVSRRFLGQQSGPARFVLVIVPPAPAATQPRGAGTRG
ncbi:MAG: glycosyltransferase family 39 protein [Variibacter sp.]|nr:glycosyltransferase family 39 protein [Variibacter sp.]